MDETGSVGLDMSFVSWVFLMEPLIDASLEQQVVARAHRMGAKSIVQVETLVMRVRASGPTHAHSDAVEYANVCTHAADVHS